MQETSQISSMEHGAWRVGKSAGSGQRTASRTQRSDIRGLGSGIKLISDLRLLTSVINDFYGLNDFNELKGF
jgi:hypothetical protein